MNFKGKIILLVEDEFVVAKLQKRNLEKYGYQVIIAYSGEKAIELLQEKNSFDLILMDINLKTGMDGIEAAEVILKDHDIPIIFISSHTEDEVLKKTEKITFYGYVVKNSGIVILDKSIRKALTLFYDRIKKEEALQEIQKKY